MLVVLWVAPGAPKLIVPQQGVTNASQLQVWITIRDHSQGDQGGPMVKRPKMNKGPTVALNESVARSISSEIFSGQSQSSKDYYDKESKN